MEIQLIHQLLEIKYGLTDLDISPLGGYDNLNFKIRSKTSRYIFKAYPVDSDLKQIIQEQDQLLLALQEPSSSAYPKILPSLDKKYLHISHDGKYYYRLLNFLDGEFIGALDANEKLFRTLGQFLARMDLKLKHHNPPHIKSIQNPWDLQYFLFNKPLLKYISDPFKRSLAAYFFMQFEEQVQPRLPKLRKSLIHGDANEWNVLAQNGEVSGIIDFGDLCVSPLINEIAIAISYAIMGRDTPLKWAKIIVQAYHDIIPIEKAELDLLYYLIAARLCTSVCHSALGQHQNPENKHQFVSEKNAWKLLQDWVKINPENAKKKFYEAAGRQSDRQDIVDTLLAKRHTYLSQSMSLSYHQPIHMKGSAFQYMYDSQGNTYLDTCNNIPHIGHCHPAIVEAAKRQMTILNTNTRYLYEALHEYCEALFKKIPRPLSKIFLVNSGSAATDLAYRLASTHTNENSFFVLDQGYHGNTSSAIDLSSYKFDGKGGTGAKHNIVKLPLPDSYRSDAMSQNAIEIADKLIQNHDQPIAGFIAESIVGCGGQVVLPPGYLHSIYKRTRSKGGLCIADEVQTGFGRIGSHFWAFQQHEVVPDILILGKPMGNGHPIAAVVCTDEIAQSFENGMEFFSSFGGNPVSCVIAKTVLEVIEEEGLQEHAYKTGSYLIEEFKRLQQKYFEIGDIRGSGLFLGVELVSDQEKTPNAKLAKHIQEELKQSYILSSLDGPFHNVLKIKPPMCFNENNTHQLISTLDQILKHC